MSPTLPGILSIGSSQLSSYISAWAGLRLHQVDADPLLLDPTRIEVTGRCHGDALRFRLANAYLHRGYRHEAALFDALGVNRDDLKTALRSGVPFRAWFFERRQNLPWMNENPDHGTLVVDELFQLRRSLEQTAHRTDLWQEADFSHMPSGMVQHFAWLRHLFSTRVRLAQDADFFPALMSINTYFGHDKREIFEAIGLDESLRRFFHIRTPLPLARSA